MSRIIVVGIGDGTGTAALAWVASQVGPGDAVHVVHAYSLLEITGSNWQPALRANEQRRSRARSAVAEAVRYVRDHSPSVEVDGSAIVGRPLRVLTDLSAIADLIVIETSQRDDGVRLDRLVAARSACPTVTVPRLATDLDRRRDAEPVALLLDRRTLPRNAVEFSFEQAAARGVSLVVVQPADHGPSGLPVSDDDVSWWDSEEQQTLDGDLAVWREKYRDAGVVVELRREPAGVVAPLLHRTCQLVIVARATGTGPQLSDVARAAMRRATCPVAVVPD
jgi:hypothetical protein